MFDKDQEQRRGIVEENLLGRESLSSPSTLIHDSFVQIYRKKRSGLDPNATEEQKKRQNFQLSLITPQTTAEWERKSTLVIEDPEQLSFVDIPDTGIDTLHLTFRELIPSLEKETPEFSKHSSIVAVALTPTEQKRVDDSNLPAKYTSPHAQHGVLVEDVAIYSDSHRHLDASRQALKQEEEYFTRNPASRNEQHQQRVRYVAQLREQHSLLDLTFTGRVAAYKNRDVTPLNLFSVRFMFKPEGLTVRGNFDYAHPRRKGLLPGEEHPNEVELAHFPMKTNPEVQGLYEEIDEKLNRFGNLIRKAIKKRGK